MDAAAVFFVDGLQLTQPLRCCVLDLGELTPGQAVQEGEARAEDALDTLDRSRCHASDAAAVFLVGAFQAVQLAPGQIIQGVESGLCDAPDALHGGRCRAPDTAAVFFVDGLQLAQPLRCCVLQLGELASGEIVQEGIPSSEDALHALYRSCCHAPDAAAVFLVGAFHVVQFLLDGGLRRPHDAPDHVADCAEDVPGDLQGRAQLLLEETQDCIDAIAEPLALVVEQHQGRYEGHDAYDYPGHGVGKQGRCEAPHGAYERCQCALCQ